MKDATPAHWLLVGLGVFFIAYGCSRDIAVCVADAKVVSAAAVAKVCRAQGYTYAQCPDHDRISAELKKELEACYR